MASRLNTSCIRRLQTQAGRMEISFKPGWLVRLKAANPQRYDVLLNAALWSITKPACGGRNLSHRVLSSWLLSSPRPPSQSKLAKMNWTTFVRLLWLVVALGFFSVVMLQTSGDSLNFYCLEPESPRGWFWSSAWPWEQRQPQDSPACRCRTLPLGAQASIFMFLRTAENHSHWVKFSQTMKALNFQKDHCWAARASPRRPSRERLLVLFRRCTGA